MRSFNDRLKINRGEVVAGKANGLSSLFSINGIVYEYSFIRVLTFVPFFAKLYAREQEMSCLITP
jgi:hypothetical protein